MTNRHFCEKFKPYYQEDVKQITLNHTILNDLALQLCEAFVEIFLNADLFLSQTPSGFPSIGKFWSCDCLSFHQLSIKLKRRCLLDCIAYEYPCADWDGLCDQLRDVPWEDIFKLGASATASKFCEWVQVGIDVYIPHCKYQVKCHSSPWLSAAWVLLP